MRHPARILYCTSDFKGGGTQRYLLTLLGGLDRRRFEPAVACLSDQGELAPAMRATGVPIRCYPIRDPLWHPRSLAAMAELSGWIRSGFDLVHTLVGHANVFGLVAARLGRQHRVIVSQRSLHPVSGSFREASPAMVALGRWLFRHAAQRVLVNNPAIAEALLREGVPAARIVTIANGIDVERFRPTKDRAVERRAERLDEAAQLVGFVGRLIPDKGLARLLDAAETLATTRPRLEILAVGDGPERAALEAKAGRGSLSGRVHFFGFRDDTERLYPLLDVFAFPSTYSEGTPNALLEAMACGVPVVAHRMLQVERMIRENETGLLVDCTAPYTLARAIADVLDDPMRASSLGRAARDEVSSRYGLANMLDETERLYEAELAA